MSWRGRLAEQRAKKIQKGLGDQLTKPTKGAFVSFVSAPDGHSGKIAAPHDPAVRADTRIVLLALADRLAVDRDHVHRLDDDGLTLLAAIGEGGMRAFLLAAEDAATRKAGKVPPTDTAAIHCAHCGPVHVHPDIAAVLPVVAGWPRAAGCPWCAIRKVGGYVPRPRVTCESCTHRKPDAVNPEAGVGDCISGHGTHYPMQQHGCDDFDPRETP